MREIKFKGKRVDNGEWVYGYYCYIGYTGQEKHYIIPSYASVFYGFEVDPMTICQYISRKDKNGPRLFSGDVIRWRQTESDEWEKSVIRWCGDRGYPAYDVYPFIDCDSNGLSMLFAADYEIEVIGNIHDNPELIKERENHG